MELTNLNRDPERSKIILDALQESMRTVQRALLRQRGVPGEQLISRLVEWQRSLDELQQRISREDPSQATLQLATLYEISQAINSSLDLDVTLNTVLDALIQLAGAERGCLMLLDEDAELSTQVARGFDRTSELKLSHTVIREAVDRGEPVLTTNAQVDPRFSAQTSVVGFRLRSIICVPLRVRGQVTGALYLDNRIKEAAFSEAELPLLTAFANQAATAIENARLYTLTDQKLAARVQELTAMQQVDRELNASLDLKRVMELTLAWAMRATGADCGALSLLEEDGRILTRAEMGTDARPDPLERDQVMAVLRGREPVMLGRQRVLIPICRERQAMGLLDLCRDGDGAFSPGQAHFAGQLATHAAIAIENARLYDQVRQANQAKSEFVSIVAHELRTPMTAIRGYADMLARGILGALSEQQTEFLVTIGRNAERMQVLVSDLQDISRIEAEQLRLEVEPTSLADAVQEAVGAVGAQVEGRQQRLTVEFPPDLPQVRADAARLTQVLINLLGNASKYTPEGGAIEVRACVDEGHVRCSVSDTGIGIAPEDQTRLFTKFFRADNQEVQDEPGTGLGLCIVKNLVELQGGRVDVRSQPGAGSTFSFTVPVAGDS